MRKTLIWALIIVAVLLLVYCFGSGYIKNTSAMVESYAVNDDGDEMILWMGVSSSAGYLRDMEISEPGAERIYLDFYSAFGGINGDLGAKSRYVVPISEKTRTIAIYRDKDCYEEVLVKNDSGEWVRK